VPQEKTSVCKMNDEIVPFALQEWDRRLNDNRFVISKSSFELKQRWRVEILGTLNDIVQASNPFLKLRDCLTNSVVRTSYYQLLMNHPSDDSGHPLSSISHPKISWRLSEHISEVTHNNTKLRLVVEAHGENVNELLDYVRYTYESNFAYLSAINAARTMMQDIGDDVDWLPQFYISMCIWQEDMVRKQIAIPSLFNNEEQSEVSDSTKYWKFKEFVKSGSKFPHRDWQQLYGSDLLEASGRARVISTPPIRKT
jgi:hypothetical protein